MILCSLWDKAAETPNSRTGEVMKVSDGRNDYVLHLYSTSNDLPSELTLGFSGPLIVLSHIGNDVTCTNLMTDFARNFYVSRLKLFVGNSTQAYSSALRDNNQYTMKSILAYRGIPLLHT